MNATSDNWPRSLWLVRHGESAGNVARDSDGQLFRNVAGNPGLATAGSGDALAGVIAGLAARGAEPLQAAVWGVWLHAKAGEALAWKVGRSVTSPASSPAKCRDCLAGRHDFLPSKRRWPTTGGAELHSGLVVP